MSDDEKYGHDDDTLSIVSSSEFSPSSALSPLRSYLRSLLLPVVERESHYVAYVQKRFRSPWWDKYFVYSSALGTHTFFMILLPAMYFFGFDIEGITNREMGLGLVMIMGGGVYSSSFLKDLVCSPRPLAPPVTRLTLGNHHLEYGFPSTHSTNSVSIALFFWGYVHTLLDPSETFIYWLSTALCAIYALSIVGGRIYTAMHSFVDCIFGVLLGAAVWWCTMDHFGGLGLSRKMHEWVASAALGLPLSTSAPTFLNSILSSKLFSFPLSPPLILTSFFLLIINQHPQPIDDCPCFEDAIASGAVVYGAFLGRWATTYFRLDGLVETIGGPKPMIGSGWQVVDAASLSANIAIPRLPGVELNPTTKIWMPLAEPLPLTSYLLFCLTASLKLLLGITLIFLWRLIAKSLLSLILPPIFRLVAKGVGFIKLRSGVRWLGMPNRRFYLPATEYRGPVPGLGMGFDGDDEDGDEDSGRGRSRRMRPIPSMIDLPSTLKVSVEEEGGIGSASYLLAGNGHGLRRVNGDSEGGTGRPEKGYENEEKVMMKEGSGRKFQHYDADVLTKVIVYAGIAIISIEVVPVVFELLGWGVYIMPPLGAVVLR